jgi:hypothetical protein
MNVFSAFGLLLAQDGGSILLVDPDTKTSSVLVSGLDSDRRVSFHAHADQIYWTNGVTNGRITSAGVALNWGCAVAPTPTLGTTSGALRAGNYLVAATFVDASGIEHAAGKSAPITLDGTQAITVDLSSVDVNAASIKLYATNTDQSDLFFVKSVSPDTLPAVITAVEQSEEPLRTQFLSPPLPADCLFDWRGQMLLAIGNALVPSMGVAAHLYELGLTVQTYPSDILAGAGVDDGFWVICTRGIFWTTARDGDPRNWTLVQRDNRLYAAGALVLDATMLPALQTSGAIAVFVSEHGPVVGMPGGLLRPLTHGRFHLDVEGKRATFAVRQFTSVPQILFTLE